MKDRPLFGGQTFIDAIMRLIGWLRSVGRGPDRNFLMPRIMFSLVKIMHNSRECLRIKIAIVVGYAAATG